MNESTSEGKTRQRGRKVNVIVTPSALVFPLDEEHRKAAEGCLRRSGKITFAFKEIAVTNLTELVGNGDGGTVID